MQQNEVAQRCKGFRFVSDNALAEQDLTALIAAIGNPRTSPPKTLGGRGVVSDAVLSDGTAVVIKHYRRGGVLRHVVDRRYVRTRFVRPRAEFEMLRIVRNLGVAAPRPISWITKGALVYEGWLVSETLPDALSLSELSVDDESAALALIPEVAQHLAVLVTNRIFHVDLHPGNVLLSAGVPYIIDFDKAYRFKGPRKKLRDLYLCRWRRAVLKHGLSESLVEGMCSMLLREDFGTRDE